jgi:hypothetical protein
MDGSGIYLVRQMMILLSSLERYDILVEGLFKIIKRDTWGPETKDKDHKSSSGAGGFLPGASENPTLDHFCSDFIFLVILLINIHVASCTKGEADIFDIAS